MLTFDEALRNTSTEGFLRMLRDRWNVSRMLLGFNNRFGYDAPSDFAEYQQIGRKCDIEIERGTEFSSTASQTVSSSEIRRLILNHEIPGANALLGRRYSLVGKVAHGQAIGRTIGFPTANVVPASGRKLIPPGGVYAAEALTTDGSRYAAMVNIGARPTICPDGATPTIEANLIGFDGDLYGTQLALNFIAYMRHERKFPSLDALQAQLFLDRTAALRLSQS